MHRYAVSCAVLNGYDVRIRRHFATRDKAINYMIDYFESHEYRPFQLEEENELAKHRIEYVNDDYNRFTVVRM